MNKTVCKANMCLGCGACVESCPKDAIKLVDSMVAYNATIDEKKCIECGLCHKVCQVINPPAFYQPNRIYEGWTVDQYIRKIGTSGGVATAIECEFAKMGGVVCSLQFKEGKFDFLFVEEENDIFLFSGSKYVKSIPNNIYIHIKDYIHNNRKVLFVGLPCQVAAVKNYIGDNENLFTIDLICHGAPSTKILESFFNSNKINYCQIKKIIFRIKECQEKKANQIRFSVPIVLDNYMYTFLNSTIYSECCYSCKYARDSRVSDITLGDSWGSKQSKDIRNNGISLILCQTEKGYMLLKNTNLQLFDVDFSRAIKWNRPLNSPPERPKQRKGFMKAIIKGKNFNSVMFRYFPKAYIKNIIKTLLFNHGIVKGRVSEYNIICDMEDMM